MSDKLFELTIGQDDESGVFALSFVDSPAIESNFIFFNDLKKVEFINEEKRIVTGAALIPNLPIPRLNGAGGYYNVFLSEKTIEEVSIKFFKNGFQNTTTLQHKIPLSKNIIFESWIVKDKEKDKSALLGIDVPIGTWMISAKIENPELWSKVKSGEVKGFSIEGIFNQIPKSEFKKHKIEMSKKQNFITKMMNKVKEMFMQTALEDGTVVDINEETGVISYVNDDDSLTSLVEGEYTLLDGTVIKVDAESKIVKEPAKEETKDLAVEPAKEEETKEEGTTYTLEDGTEVKADGSGKIDLADGEHKLSDGKILVVEAGIVKEVKEAEQLANQEIQEMSKVKEELNSYKTQVSELTEKYEKEKADKKKLKDRIKELEAEPAGLPVAVTSSNNVSEKALTFAEQVAMNVRKLKENK